MGAQSLVLGKQFGEGFQYGKRKISAMSNEEFNKLTPAKLAQDNAEELKQMIPSMMGAITDMRSFQSFIVKELIETVKQLPGDIFGGLTGDLQTSTSFSKTGPTNTAYAGSLGLPYAALAGIEPGTKLWQDTFDKITKELALAAKITSGSKTKIKNPGPVLLQTQKTAGQIQKLTTQAIQKSTSPGVVQDIASLFKSMTYQLATAKSKHVTSRAANIKAFLGIAKLYNQLVAKNGMSNLQVDTAKSIKALSIVPK